MLITKIFITKAMDTTYYYDQEIQEILISFIFRTSVVIINRVFLGSTIGGQLLIEH